MKTLALILVISFTTVFAQANDSDCRVVNLELEIPAPQNTPDHQKDCHLLEIKNPFTMRICASTPKRSVLGDADQKIKNLFTEENWNFWMARQMSFDYGKNLQETFQLVLMKDMSSFSWNEVTQNRVGETISKKICNGKIIVK